MAGINLQVFGGLIPKLSPQLLPPTAAQETENAELYSGELRSFNLPLSVYTSAKESPQSAYRMFSGGTDYWLTWTNDVDAVRAAVAGDSTFKLYYTGDTTDDGLQGPKKTNLSLATGASNYPADFLELGIPQPTVAPTIATSGGTGTNETHSYFYTLYSSTWDEEGPPSDSVEATYKIDGTWSVVTGTATPGTSTHYAIDKKRIYRTVVSATGLVNWHRVVEIGLGTATYADDRATNTDTVIARNPIAPTVEVTGEGLVISGSEWDPPPTDLAGICSGANGMMGAFSPSAKTVCFCEPYRPHAWPGRYQYALPWTPVAMGAAGNVFYVATKGRPYIFVGNHPGAMTQIQVERDDMPCLSKRSAVVTDVGMIYSAPHGPAVIGLGGASYLMQHLLEEAEWQAYFPSSIVARLFNNRYFGFFDSGAKRGGFIFHPNSQSAALMLLNLSAEGAYTDPETSKLYLIRNGGIYLWEGDTDNFMERMWRSKVFWLPKPINLGAYQVDADYAALSGDFAAEQAQIAEDEAFNAALLASLSDNWAAGTGSKTRGDLGGHCLGGYHPDMDGPTGANNHGIMLGGHLFIGGVYSTYTTRYLQLDVYAYDYEDDAMKLVFTDTLTSGKPGKMYDADYKSDAFEFILRGTLNVRRVVLGETMADLARVV